MRFCPRGHDAIEIVTRGSWRGTAPFPVCLPVTPSLSCSREMSPSLLGALSPRLPGALSPSLPGAPSPSLPGAPSPSLPGAPSPSLPGSPVPEPPRSPLRVSVVLGIITQVARARARARTGRTAPPASVHRQLWAGAASTPPVEAPVPRPGVCRKDEPQREGLGVFHLLRGCHLITVKASPPRSVGCPGRSSSRAPGHVRWQLPPSPPRPATHARPPETVQRHLPLHVLFFAQSGSAPPVSL